MYSVKINIFLDTYAPFKRIDKFKLRFKSKPWINLALQKSISLKKKLLSKFINKITLHRKRKLTLNTITSETLKSKLAYYNEYFEAN